MKQLLLTLYFLLPLVLCAQVVNITDADLEGNKVYNWTKNNTYILDGLVFLETGGVLNIEAGTVVKFTDRADVGNPSALVITRGAKIYAEGTADAPIIFTAIADDVNNPTDLGPTDNALWGGIVILGKGITQKSGNSEVNIEGISLAETRGQYGGTDNNDDSGVMRYVSIRHGGRQIISGNELNGLSLGAVGSKTVLEYIEIYANSDDGIEFFGGAPNVKYAVVAFAEDDSYDWDEVFVGKGQFWFSIQRSDIADAGGELDGTTPDDLTPYSNPTVYNWTHIGAGPGAAASNPVGWLLRAGTGGTIANSIVTEMKNKAIEVQDRASGVNDAYSKLGTGELKIQNNLFWRNGSNTSLDGTSTGIIRITSGAEDATAAALITHLTNNVNEINDPGIMNISRIQDETLDPRPLRSGAAYNTSMATYPNDAFFTQVNYKGAFGSNADNLWIQGWTALDQNNHLKDLSTSGTTINITDADLEGNKVYNWTKNNTYILDGLVFLETGGVLNIEAGTVVKFTDRADVGNPSALVITRGAKIYAEGTADAPIIFTAIADDVNNPTDLGPTDNALWGGIVILGKGITQKSGNAEVNIEGISLAETRGQYGGTDNNDDSGVMRYVTIRHGGRQIISGNELNGLSLGAVGSKTVLEYIEIYANSDDGIEFFGGAPNVKYAVVAFAEDDSYDWDEVYVGKGQFWFSIQRPDIADAGGELDGTTPDDLTPFSSPAIYNWTHIGAGPGAAASNPVGWLFRAGTAGTVANSIVTEMKNKAIEVQDRAAGVNDAYSKLGTGELKIQNNLFWKNGSNTTLDGSATGIIRITSGAEDATAAALIAHLTNNQNSINDPGIRSISRIQDGKLDPRPLANGAAYNTPLAVAPMDGFYTMCNFKGAFPADAGRNWIHTWTTLDRNGHLSADISTGNEDEINPTLAQFDIYPNTVSKGREVTIATDVDEKIRIEIYTINGQFIQLIPADAVKQSLNFLERGLYIIKFKTESGKIAVRKLIVE
ncbi:MAG: T9SS type A sorting domain-containing protein [Saprospiraceae bacterium]|nr:T9SS type A sorting domain-containing protein [Saprospiraceae bacterium]